MRGIVRRKTEVSITLSRSSNCDGSEWVLRVIDKRSAVEILQARLDHLAFADMMSSTMGGNLAQAEIALVPWIGKYAVHHSETVDTRGVNYNELPAWLNEQGEQMAKDLRRFEGDYTDLGWRYTGFQGGGGGSQNRTLTFVKFADEKPEEDPDGTTE